MTEKRANIVTFLLSASNAMCLHTKHRFSLTGINIQPDGYFVRHIFQDLVPEKTVLLQLRFDRLAQ
jgi:hypothetical protein